MTKSAVTSSIILVALLSSNVHSWSFSSSSNILRKPVTTATPSAAKGTTLFPTRRSKVSTFSTATPAVAAAGGDEAAVKSNTVDNKKKEKMQQLRKEGGIFSFNTKYGALNPYGIFYGLTAIALGIVWYAALTTCQLFYWVTRGKFDRFRRIPVTCSQTWGVLLMLLTGQMPPIENKKILLDFYKKNKAAMFVANHNSWMDIPYLGHTVGWRNYKIIAKAELSKVPILSKSIKVGGNVMVDRTDRRSQLKTLKDGIQWLKDGVHLCTFPEGTRSRTGRLLPFKKGAFKMAHKCGAPVVPLSIVGSGKVNPPNWMFPCKPSFGIAKVVVHEPIESEGKTEDELAEAVRKSIISGLPEDQHPKQKS